MTNFPLNRVPQGVPTGGQFSPTSHPEPAVALADPATRFVRLIPGDADDYPELADGEVIERLSIRRSDEDHGYWVSAAKSIDFHHIITPADLETDEEGRDAWLEDHALLIENFMAERYDAEMVDQDEDWSHTDVEFHVPMPDSPLTEAQAVDAAWNRSKIVQLHNESDHGTFGSENLGRLIRERAESSTMVGNFYGCRGEALRMDDDRLDAQVAARTGHREISDAAALAVARRLSDNGDYPALRSLAIHGYADTKQLNDELSAAWCKDQTDPRPTPRIGRRIDMMFTWVLHGGDND